MSSIRVSVRVCESISEHLWASVRLYGWNCFKPPCCRAFAGSLVITVRLCELVGESLWF